MEGRRMSKLKVIRVPASQDAGIELFAVVNRKHRKAVQRLTRELWHPSYSMESARFSVYLKYHGIFSPMKDKVILDALRNRGWTVKTSMPKAGTNARRKQRSAKESTL